MNKIELETKHAQDKIIFVCVLNKY